MKRLLLFLFVVPLLAGACSDDTTDDPGTEPPATTLPAGTKDDPFGVADLAAVAAAKSDIWIKGYVAGAEAAAAPMSVGSDTPSRDNILLASKANEYRPDKCVRVELAEDSDIQARLNVVDHPDLVGKKVMLRGDIVLVNGIVRVANLSEQEGGKEPVENTDPEPEPDPEPDPEPEDPNPPITGNVELDKLYGYAEGTTGGAGATAAQTHHFDDGKKFGEWLYLREKNKDMTPAIVWLSGTFHKDDGYRSGKPWFDVKRTGNLSIYGTDDFVMENVGFFINESSNIILRNIYIKMPKADDGADGISMQESNNIWVDHCTFESVNQVKDYEDGSCDVTHQTYNVTVSWSHFIKTQKTCLVGHSNGQTADTKITVTFHHNFFDLSSSRHPRVRFGRAHVYNNYFNRVTTYGVGSAYGAMVLVEDNSFEGVRLPIDICTYPAKPSGNNWVSNLTGSVAGYVYERGNLFNNRPSDATDPYPFTNVEYLKYNGNKLPTPLTYEDFKPSYSYIVDEADRIAEIVPSGAGVGKLTGFATAPVPVNNGGIQGGGTDPDPGPDPGPEPEPGGSDLGNGWTLLSNGAASAAATSNNGQLSLTACGKFESGKQVFGIVHREATGDFVLTAQIDSYDTPGTSNQSLAGVILSPNADATGTEFIHAIAAQGPSSAFYYSNRASSGSNAGKGGLTAPSATVDGAKPIVKIERAGDKCSASYSLDGGATFGKPKDVEITGLAQTLRIGLVVSSGNSTKPATAVFSNVKLNGEAVAFE